jgi:uncharacterized protein YndB with AHSA1/START domain
MPGKNDNDENWVGREFTFTREFDAPRELVFRACTEPDHLAQWWGPKGFSNPICQWDAKPGGEIFVVMRSPDGTDYPMGGKFIEVVPPHRLVNTTGALDEHGNLLFEILHTLTLAETAGKTTLKMHSKVIMATPGAGRFLGGFQMGMNLSLDRLKEHLTSNTEPLVVKRTFNAPAALVWNALIERNAIKQWSFNIAEFKPVVGFEFEFTAGKEGRTKFLHHCRVTDVIPLKRLAYTWRYAGHAGDSLVTFDLHAEGDQTRVRITHTGLETFPAIADLTRENFLAGWTFLLGTSLKDFLEKKEKSHA